jgi:16S rRNA A1518/A1519 N6-dimethyltransferase RsmA/KsgA/DIM1 with predicted DNA glycosylase/AP lyase activity
LETDWVGLAVEKGGPLSLIGNLPFNISSQILFDIIDNRRAVSHALFTTQYEVCLCLSHSPSLILCPLYVPSLSSQVARRIISPPRTKEYGILSVAFQLYSRPEYKFTIPSTAFYPAPKVTSAQLTFPSLSFPLCLSP